MNYNIEQKPRLMWYAEFEDDAGKAYHKWFAIKKSALKWMAWRIYRNAMNEPFELSEKLSKVEFRQRAREINKIAKEQLGYKGTVYTIPGDG